MMMSATSLLIATSALVGLAMAPNPALATLPLALQFIATMVSTIPAALLMQRTGRRRGFMLGTLFAISGALCTAAAIVTQQFWLFCGGVFLMGVFNGFGVYFRFAAADIAAADFKARAISWVMAGGVAAALIGPNLANQTRSLIASAPFAASYAALLLLYITILIALLWVQLPNESPSQALRMPPSRTLRRIISQPHYIVAVLSGMLGYAVMSLVMTATPLAMHHDPHPFSDTSWVIQWHVLGMFAPSFFTGGLILRFGAKRIILCGALLELMAVFVHLSGTTLTHYWVGLLLLGLGWNFLFIGATTLLTATYSQSERTKAQATNDFILFTGVALASLSAGALQHQVGWAMVNLIAIPLLLCIFIALVWLQRYERRQLIDRH